MEYYKLDVVARTFTVSQGFAKRMQDITSDEFELYSQFMEKIPTLRVVYRTHKTPSKYINKNNEVFHCNQFKNLTYANMERFIKALPQNEIYLKEFRFAKDTAAKIQTNAYTPVRLWFMKQFPEFRRNPLFYLHHIPDIVHVGEVIEESDKPFLKEAV